MSSVSVMVQALTSWSRRFTVRVNPFKMLFFLQSNFRVSSLAMYASLSSNISVGDFPVNPSA